MKEIYTSNHMWKLFENFLVDICRVRLAGALGAGFTRVCARASVQVCVGTPVWTQGNTP